MKDLYGNDDIEAIYQAALRVPLAEKIQMALLTIQTYEKTALALSPDGFYVCFSGGKDSIVLADLFKKAGVTYELHTSHTTLDAPQLVQFIKDKYPEAIQHKQPEAMLNYMVSHGKGLPSRLGRWCCSSYKENGGVGYFNAVGVRAPESPRRKGLWRQVMTDTRTKKQILAPILYWTDEDVWEYIKSDNLAYPVLYDAPYNFKRVGCTAVLWAAKTALKNLSYSRNMSRCGKPQQKDSLKSGKLYHARETD